MRILGADFHRASMSAKGWATRLILLFAAGALAISVTEAQAQNRVRKNVDQLTAPELRNYIHAFRKLVQISEADPNSLDGILFFQAQHNDLDVGPCEHGRDTFFPWHRAHLHLFEQALRRSDPPRTADVTLPYWDWSELPTGRRFPAIFEMKVSTGPVFAGTGLEGIPNPLYIDGRTDDPPICKDGMTSGCAKLPFPRSWIDEKVLTIKSWAGVGEAGFGGKASGESQLLPAPRIRIRTPGGHGPQHHPRLLRGRRDGQSVTRRARSAVLVVPYLFRSAV